MKRIEISNNFFSRKDIAIIKNYCEEFTSDNTSDKWSRGLSIGRGKIKIMYIDPQLDKKVYSIVHDTMFKEFNLKPKAVNFHFCDPESFINWHDDGPEYHIAGATVYLNQNWNINDGGLFLYRDFDKNIRGERPEFNKCIFQQGGVMHSTTPTHWKSPVRKSLQVFF